MASAVRIVRDRKGALDRPLLAIAGSMLGLSGAALAIGGTFVTSDSSFFMFAGFGLIVTGALLAKRHWAGAWTYSAVFAATLFWSLQDLQMGGSPLAYRLVGPAILVALMAVMMPVLGRGNRARIVNACAALIVATLVGGIFAAGVNDPADRLAVVGSQLPQSDGGLQ